MSNEQDEFPAIEISLTDVIVGALIVVIGEAVIVIAAFYIAKVFL